MTTFTTEDREAMHKGLERKPEHYSHYKSETIQGVTGAQYSFVDTSPQAYEVTKIINTICAQLQALSTVIKQIQASQNQKENNCGK